MGIKTKLAKGPNPLSRKKKKTKGDGEDSTLKKRRKRAGKRSKELSLMKR